MTENAETPVVEIVPIAITIASVEDVASAVEKLEELRELDIETRTIKPVNNTGKFVLAAHASGDATEEDLKANFTQGNITFEHSAQVRADFNSVFKTLYNYTLSLNVPELSGLAVTETSSRKKGDTPSDKTFAARLAKDSSLSVEKILESMMKEAKGTPVPRTSWKYIGYVNGTATCSCLKPNGLWEKVTGQYPGSVSDKMKLHIGVLGEGRK